MKHVQQLTEVIPEKKTHVVIPEGTRGGFPERNLGEILEGAHGNLKKLFEKC